MLRITQTIELDFRQKESRFSRDFWKGLGLAAALHLSLFIAFRVVTPPNLDRFKPIAPVSVEIDLGAKEVVSLPPAQIIYSPIEALEPPQHLHIPEFTLQSDLFTLNKLQRNEPDFSEIEKIEYTLIEDEEIDD